jgi:hypothetical protein
MKVQEIENAIAMLNALKWSLEQEYMENGGEVTEQTIESEERIIAMKSLLSSEGVDSLGRWMKSVEDETKSYKAERDFANRRIKANDNLLEYIKGLVNKVLVATEQEKVKGTFYSFTATTSETTSVDKETLNNTFLEAVEKKLRGGKKPVIPSDVTITLGASIKNVPEGAKIPAYYLKNSKPSVRFTKPRASKEV